MFDYIKGIFTDKNILEIPTVTVEACGIGYLITISNRDLSALSEINTEIKVYTVLVHREDSMTLYGFLSKDARNIFNMLTTVSGVGPKMAMQILNIFEPSEIISNIVNENPKELTKTKGVGLKLAQKIVIELKDKLSDIQIETSFAKESADVNEKLLSEVQEILTSFGYEPNEIKEAVQYSLSYADSDSTSEDVLKYALKFLSE